jgi:glycosyltransferase involved in cell wall biosynthesis
MNQPRILQVAGGPVFDLGGMGKVVQWLAADLSGNFRVSLASSDATAPGLPEEMAARLENRLTVPFPKWNKTSRVDFLRRVKADQYDLIHFHGGTFSFDAHLPWRSPLHRLCLAGVPWILTNHCAPSLTEGLFPPKYPAVPKLLKSLLAWWSKGFLLVNCGQEVFASDENRGQIDRWFPWAKGKMRTIYNSGLEGSPPPPVVSPEVVTIGNLGHISWRKGQHDLLKAFILTRQKHPRLRLVLAGPPLEEDCARWIRDEISRQNLGGVVQLPGGLNDKTAFWRDVDIYVQPSQYEGAPMALMEALWLGKPAVGTRVSGIPEMIQHDVNGLLVESGQPAEMAAAIERLAAEPDTRRRFSQNAAAHLQSKGMTRKDMSGKYAALYEEILDKRPGAR